MNMKAILAVMSTTQAVVKMKPEKIQAGAVLYQLSEQANRELVITVVS